MGRTRKEDGEKRIGKNERIGGKKEGESRRTGEKMRTTRTREERRGQE